jgi:pimeloyl-ACP methyl ester carboxylesterase
VRKGFIALLAVLMAACCGCVVPQGDLRLNAGLIAAQGQLLPMMLDAGPFRLAAYARLSSPGLPLRVYIEGDGRAWITRRQVSLDPTPRDPVALRLAAADPTANVVWLARPCQFVSGVDWRSCNPHDWTDQRYAPRIVEAMDLAVESLRAAAATEQVELIGFSGGGALAVLIAARRSDVATIRTVAGNLDIEAFATIHRISPLNGSLNPRDAAVSLAETPQLHLVGAEDSVVSPVLVESYQAQLPHRRCSRSRLIEGAAHQSGWAERWAALLAWAPVCQPPGPVPW